MGDRRGAWDQGHYQFDQVTAVDGQFTLDNLAWHSCHSFYTRCVFRQTGMPTNPIAGYSGAQGLFGHCPSTYQDCTFDHVDFGVRGGGFLLGEARFERCTFRYCRYRWFQATHADFIDCTFIGVMRSARFWGTSPQGDERPRRNQFSGNDLSRAKPRRVEFRNGVDLRTNRLPRAPNTSTWTASASAWSAPGRRSLPGPRRSAATPRSSLTSTNRKTWTACSPGGGPLPARRPRCGPSWRPWSYPGSRHRRRYSFQPQFVGGCKSG